MSSVIGLLGEENSWEFLFNHVSNQSQSELNGISSLLHLCSGYNVKGEYAIWRPDSKWQV